MEIENHEQFSYPVYVVVQKHIREISDGDGILYKGEILKVNDIKESELGYTVICEDNNIWLGAKVHNDLVKFYKRNPVAEPTLESGLSELGEALKGLWKATGLKPILINILDWTKRGLGWLFDSFENIKQRWK